MQDAYASNFLLGIGRTLAASVVALIQINQIFLLPIFGLAVARWALF